MAARTVQIPGNRVQQRNRLREAREAAGVSTRELQERSGVSKPTINQIENHGFYPSDRVQQELAQALDVSVGWLFYVEGEPGTAPRKGGAQ